MVTKEDIELKKYYPQHIDNKFHAYRGGINFDWGGMAYDVFKKDIGGPVHHYDDPVVEHALTKALGKRIPIVNPTLLSNIPKALMITNNTFPKELTLTKILYPIICTPFDKSPPKYDPLSLEIYVTPSEFFTVKPRNVFTDIVLKHVTSKESYNWLSKPDMTYYPQQLSFALWIASSGCGVSYEMLHKYPPMINSLLRFHILFTTRRVLSQMGIKLPDDRSFTNIDNKYDKNGFYKVCREFDVSLNSDYRFTGGDNNGLGRIYKKIFGEINDVTEAYNEKMDGLYTNKWPGGKFKFVDEDGQYGGNKIDHISPLQEDPYRYFLLNESQGLTLAGLSRLNQSIEAYVYCILGSQVNTRSSIIGDSGSGLETQNVFLQLFESSVIERDISKSIQRYQLAIQEAKVRLDLAIAPGCWLMPSNLVINTQSVVGYNNKLQRASIDMKFGVNDINDETKSISIRHNMGISKVKLPHQDIKKLNTVDKPDKIDNFHKPTPSSKTHENNLIIITIGVAGLAWYMFR